MCPGLEFLEGRSVPAKRAATLFMAIAAFASVIAVAMHTRRRTQPKWVTRLDVSAMPSASTEELTRELESMDEVFSVEVEPDHREAAVWHRTSAPGDLAASLRGNAAVRVIETVTVESFEEETGRRASPKKRKSCCGE